MQLVRSTLQMTPGLTRSRMESNTSFGRFNSTECCGCWGDASGCDDGRPAIAEYWMLNVTAAVTTRTFGRVVANLQWEPIRVEGVARDGDVLHVESEILGKRMSSSRPDQGIAHVAARARLQDGTPVLSFERRFLMYLSPAGPHSAAGYV